MTRTGMAVAVAFSVVTVLIAPSAGREDYPLCVNEISDRQKEAGPAPIAFNP
jgi:hypothetical protein